MQTVLKLLKNDLGINHDLKDEYFTNLVEACLKELDSRGAKLDILEVDDIMLLSDYCAWVYRKRMENTPISQNLKCRIRNRQIRGRAGD